MVSFLYLAGLYLLSELCRTDGSLVDLRVSVFVKETEYPVRWRSNVS